MNDFQFFKEFHDALKPLNKSLVKQVEENFGNIFIFGLPRSGTTILSQLIFSYTNCFCTNNLMARFWDSPLVGAYLSKYTIQKGQKFNFSSFQGQTNSIFEPHEFSKFWQKYSYEYFLEAAPPEHSVDDIIKNFNYILGGPLVFKPMELIERPLEKIIHKLDKSIFIFIDRDAFQIANSIFKIRTAHPNACTWWGSIPYEANLEELEALCIEEQVAFQVKYFRDLYKKIIDVIPKDRFLLLNYDELCDNPRVFLDRLCSTANALDAKIELNNFCNQTKLNKGQNASDIPQLLCEYLQAYNISNLLSSSLEENLFK